MQYFKIQLLSKRGNGEIINRQTTYIKRTRSLKEWEGIRNIKFLEAWTVEENTILGTTLINSHKFGDIEVYYDLVTIDKVKEKEWMEVKYKLSIIQHFITSFTDEHSRLQREVSN